jgi:hypothetical protein
VKEEE